MRAILGIIKRSEIKRKHILYSFRLDSVSPLFQELSHTLFPLCEKDVKNKYMLARFCMIRSKIAHITKKTRRYIFCLSKERHSHIIIPIGEKKSVKYRGIMRNNAIIEYIEEDIIFE